MYVGKTLFAQVMDVSFVEDFSSHRGSLWRRLSNSQPELCRAVCIMAFAQLTYRESLRDIEVCLAAQQAKL